MTVAVPFIALKDSRIAARVRHSEEKRDEGPVMFMALFGLPPWYSSARWSPMQQVGSWGRSAATPPTGASCPDVLRARYARGEISREEYQEMRQDLDA